MNDLRRGLPGLLILLGVGGLCGLIARGAGLPLPFLVGGLAGGLISVPVMTRLDVPHAFPKPLRPLFVAVIGVLIGATFTPDLLAVLPSLPITLAAMTLFVPLAHALGYVICRRIGGYDRPTALFSAMPGGLIEGIAFGQEVGGDVRVLTLHHFARVISVAVLVPILFLLWKGEVVGSSAGQALVKAGGLVDVAIVIVLSAIGMAVGMRIRLPAGHLMGPMILAGAIQASGLWTVGGPEWLLDLAQLMVGGGLAHQMGNPTLALARRVVLASLSMVVAVLTIGICVGFALANLVPLSLEALILSFSPGGVAEMGLIALSLHISPVIVAAHHTYRIALTVIVAAFLRHRALRAA